MTLQDAQLLIPDKKSMYKAMLRNGYCMPRLKSSLCCLKWMKRVRAGKYWCPRVHEIRPFNCADPPQKEEILRHLLGFATDAKKDLGITEKRMPDKEWCL